jgi:hypothetical protein
LKPIDGEVRSAHEGSQWQPTTTPNLMPISEKLKRLLNHLPAAVVLLGAVLTVTWVATLGWFFSSLF